MHFMSRTGTASGRLNLNFLPGFPVLIIDKPVNNLADYENPPVGVDDKDEYLDGLIPTQYLAYCNTLTHTISQGQEGGTTSYGLSMIRSHKEDGSKMGLESVKKYTKVDTRTKVSYILLEKNSNSTSAYRYGPHGYRISEIKKIGSPELLRKYWEPQAKAYTPGEKSSWIRLYWTYTRSAYSEAVGDHPTVYKVTEVVSVNKREIVEDIGLESALTPPWLSKVWHASNISKTYRELFGVGAVTEEMGIKIEHDARRDKEVFASGRNLPDDDTRNKYKTPKK
jgi:hypothetical protein